MKSNKVYTHAQLVKPELVFDVVCGMELEKQQVRHLAHYRNDTYYFCSIHCKQHFEATPSRYVWDK